MKGHCADESHARTRKTRFLNDWLSSYEPEITDHDFWLSFVHPRQESNLRPSD